MAADEIHVGDIGVILEGTITDGSAVDVSLASLMEILIESPQKNVLTKEAVFKTDGTDGIIQYVIQENDFHIAGTWRIQAKVILSGKTFHSDITEITIIETLGV